MIDFDNEKERQSLPMACIKVIGIGGAGGNTVNSMIDSNFKDIEFIVANTDAQALCVSKAPYKIQLGVKSTKGLGTGANPEVGKRAAEEDLDKILEVVGGADIVFIAAGMGGGTGSGASPVIAKTLREKGILTVAIVTKPFIFEGKRRAKIAQESMEKLKKEVDTLIVIPNQKLLEVVGDNVSMISAFEMINDVLNQSVKGISDIITKPGHINVDFADLKTIMKDMGFAIMGTGRAAGPNRSVEAAMRAISSPLLENMSIKGAKSVLLNITGGQNLGIHEINKAASVIYEQADEDANIIVGSVIDAQMTDEICVTVIATGFSNQKVEAKLQEEVDAQVETQDVKVQCTKLDVEPVCEEKTIVKEMSFKEVVEEQLKENKIDAEDLDVPAFLRQEYGQQEEQ